VKVLLADSDAERADLVAAALRSLAQAVT